MFRSYSHSLFPCSFVLLYLPGSLLLSFSQFLSFFFTQSELSVSPLFRPPSLSPLLSIYLRFSFPLSLSFSPPPVIIILCRVSTPTHRPNCIPIVFRDIWRYLFRILRSISTSFDVLPSTSTLLSSLSSSPPSLKLLCRWKS